MFDTGVKYASRIPELKFLTKMQLTKDRFYVIICNNANRKDINYPDDQI